MDAGFYTLKAKNELGEFKTTCNLEVKSILKFYPINFN